MNPQNINYKTLTVDQLEERVEFVDWSLVPSELLTKKIKRSFGFLPKLKARLWFEGLIRKMKIVDPGLGRGNLDFYYNNVRYMRFESQTKILWCSRNRIWLAFAREHQCNYFEGAIIITNLIKKKFRLDVKPRLD